MAIKDAALPGFEVRPLSNEEGGGYIVEFSDFPGCVADGDTPEEAIREARDALASYLLTLEALGRPVFPEGGSNIGELVSLDADVVKFYRKYGPDWRARMNRVLRDNMSVGSAARPAASSATMTLVSKERLSMSEKKRGQSYIERRAQGDYAVRRPDAERASDVLPTQKEAIERARELNPKSTPIVERARNTTGGKPNKRRAPP